LRGRECYFFVKGGVWLCQDPRTGHGGKKKRRDAFKRKKLLGTTLLSAVEKRGKPVQGKKSWVKIKGGRKTVPRNGQMGLFGREKRGNLVIRGQKELFCPPHKETSHGMLISTPWNEKKIK